MVAINYRQSSLNRFYAYYFSYLNYEFDGTKYRAYYQSDGRFPEDRFVCVTVPIELCLRGPDYLLERYGDDYIEVFGIPLLLSPTANIYENSRSSHVYMIIVYYRSFQDALEAVLQYGDYVNYVSNIISYTIDQYDYYYDSGDSSLITWKFENCGSCVGEIIIDVDSPFRLNEYGLNYNAFLYETDTVWRDFLSLNSPTLLTEKYYSCRLTTSSALVHGVGSAVGNTELLFPIFLLLLTPWMFRLLHKYGAKKTEAFDGLTQKDIHLLTLWLKMIKDESVGGGDEIGEFLKEKSIELQSRSQDKSEDGKSDVGDKYGLTMDDVA
jgi:hypothetical protein